MTRFLPLAILAALCATPALAQSAPAGLPQVSADAESVPDEPLLADHVSLSNAVAGARVRRPDKPADPVKITAAVKSGDPLQAFGLGASPMDVGKALVNRPETGEGTRRRLAAATDIAFVNLGGQVGLRVTYLENGVSQTVLTATRGLEGAEPPAGAPFVDAPNLDILPPKPRS